MSTRVPAGAAMAPLRWTQTVRPRCRSSWTKLWCRSRRLDTSARAPVTSLHDGDGAGQQGIPVRGVEVERPADVREAGEPWIRAHGKPGPTRRGAAGTPARLRSPVAGARCSGRAWSGSLPTACALGRARARAAGAVSAGGGALRLGAGRRSHLPILRPRRSPWEELARRTYGSFATAWHVR